MATYVPNATQATEPVESRTVESAALEFRTLKGSVNGRVDALQADIDAEIADRLADAAALQAEVDAVEVRTLALEQLAFNGSTPGAVTVQRFACNGVQTVFVLSVTPVTVTAVDAYINGVYQNHDTFSVSGNTVTFTEAPTAGAVLEMQLSVPLQLGTTTADAVEYTPAGTGAVATTVQSKLRETVSVFDKMTAAQVADARAGTKLIDMTAAIQNAINDTKENGTLNLGELGEVLSFSSTLTISKTINFVGYGVTLNKASDVIGIQVKSGAVYTGLKGFKLTSSVVGGTKPGIVIGEADATNGAGGCDIRDLHITKQGGDGLKIQNGNGNALTNVLADFNTGHGVNIDNAHTTTFNTNSNVLLNVRGLVNGGDGVHIGVSSSNTLTWVDAEGNTGYGIYVNQPYNLVNGYSENNTAGPMYIGANAFDCVFNVRVVTGNVAINNSGNWINTLRGDGSTPINREGTIYFRRNVVFTRVAPAYNVTTLINASLGNQFDITVTNTGAFTVGNPASAIFAGQRITVRIINASGGTLGTVTWGSNYRLSSWVSPANGFSRAIDFQYDGAKWVEVSRTPADVPN